MWMQLIPLSGFFFSSKQLQTRGKGYIEGLYLPTYTPFSCHGSDDGQRIARIEKIIIIIIIFKKKIKNSTQKLLKNNKKNTSCN
jgi:hypothetical protein